MNNVRENNIKGINLIIEFLEEIKNSKDIEKYQIYIDTDYYYKRDHTSKNGRVETSKNGSKIVITIAKGKLINEEIDFIGTKIIKDDTIHRDLHFIN